MSAAPTVAMLAAVVGKPYEVPYTGPFPYLYVREAAAAFVKAVAVDRAGAAVFDLNGHASTIEAVLERVRAVRPDAQVACRGAPFPFPPDISDAPLGAFLGGYRQWSLDEGVAETMARFATLVAGGQLGPADVP